MLSIARHLLFSCQTKDVSFYLSICLFFTISINLSIYLSINLIYGCPFISIYLYVFICWPTGVEGNPKVSFSIAISMRCKGWRYSFHWITSIILDQYLIMMSVKQAGSKYHLLSLCYDSGIEPWSPWPLANNQTITSMGRQIDR